MPSSLIAALDQALKITGEDVILRRTVGIAPNDMSIDVKCRAKVSTMTTQEIEAGLPASELNVILSPSEINAAQWPGGTLPQLPPFNVDQRVPRAGVTDKILMRGQPPRAITHVDPQIVGGELVRINLRVTG
ncbi:hypothetical protein MA20_31875 [Bradyrhizobium japonicum]|uniref:Uncharacterized protein n=1 Tax=Bradyrhizobium japonicum TaxID=375 RepID=A0A0A3XN29_BRAJP|nr:hypothetical protein [Bradyrhizobium japonicum]KGT75795.1 hypothetical protein MA20_31875 [Bradyrhizobium japonicum]